MKRLIKALVYVMGFSVFSACTTTREYPVHQLPTTETPSELSVRLVNGVGLTLGGATIGSDNVRGIIAAADSLRTGEYFGGWQAQRIERGQMEPLFEVLIPRSDIRTVRMQTADKGANAALASAGILLVGVVVAVAIAGNKTKDRFCPFGSSCD